MSEQWVRDVLEFWFTELGPAHWFVKSDVVDTDIRSRFLRTCEQLSANPSPAEYAADADAALAAILVLDQFPRNMFRGSARMYATDAAALDLARLVVEHGLDAEVPAGRRFFFYLPFEHSEALADQDRSIELFTALGDADLLRYAVAHRDIVARFDRFPHRNAILGRVSTPEEIEFLKQPGSSF